MGLKLRNWPFKMHTNAMERHIEGVTLSIMAGAPTYAVMLRSSHESRVDRPAGSLPQSGTPPGSEFGIP